jgi:hypothetical protein
MAHGRYLAVPFPLGNTGASYCRSVTGKTELPRTWSREMTQAAAEDAALEALELDWGSVYLIGYDSEYGWWAERRDELGGLIEEGSPDELRAAMAEDHALKPVTLWCPHCGQRVVFAGCMPVHATTFTRSGLDGHTAHAVGEEPPWWKAARRIAADYGGTFTVTAALRILRADWVTGPGVTAVHYTASGGGDVHAAEEDLRRQLDEATAGVQWGRTREGAAEKS